MSVHATLRLESGTGPRTVRLADYLDPEALETAQREANRWIKALRLARVDDRSLRDRFTYRGDSLWWFAELYLHKRGVVPRIFETVFALEALIDRERPVTISLTAGDRLARGLAPQIATRRHVSYRGPRGFGRGALRERLSTSARSAFYAAETVAASLRPRGQQRRHHPQGARLRTAASGCDLVAFVHSAFWQTETVGDPLHSEGYVGPVLQALSNALPAGRLCLVGVGPRTNFRARRWWHRVAEFRDPRGRLPFDSIATFGGPTLRESLQVWRDRHATVRALHASDALRREALIRGCDAWPVVREELSGIALLQFPWSARAMDEAAAALDALQPRAVVTYAEAGGWGRALVLEARRRRIPSVGLQHGFIYRHWLNYLHERDEMAPSETQPRDCGFPRPDLTLVYDRSTAQHLVEHGHFPPTAVEVTGSPRLDALIYTIRRLDAHAVAAARVAVGAGPDQALVLVASKYSQIQPAFGALVDAARASPNVCLVVKCHPAEIPAPYERAAAGVRNVRLAPSAAALPALLAAARLVVTVNSTVAIDAMVLGIPSLVVALPNNLSPFVEAGAMDGAASNAEIGPALGALLYDEERRTRLARAVRDFMDRNAIGSDGRSAERSAEAILQLIRGH